METFKFRQSLRFSRFFSKQVSIRDAAQNLLSVLQPIVQQLPDEPVGTSQPQSNLTAGQQPTVHQEMTRFDL